MRILLLTCLIVLFAECGKTQTIFAPKNAIWNYYRDGEPPTYNNKFMHEKDTFYEGHNCAKVIGFKIFADGSKVDYKPNFFYTSGDTVLYYHDSLKAFTAQYVFNVKVDDTLTFAAPAWNYKVFKIFKFIVTKTDTSIIDGIPLRNVHTKQLYPVGFGNYIYTERIGGYRIDNIISYTGPTTTDHIVGIRCYRDNDIDEHFVIDKWDCDNVPNAINEKTKDNIFSLYPIPANKTINLAINNFGKNGQVTIWSMDGRKLISKEMPNSINEIDISPLNNGIYLLRITIGNEIVSKIFNVVNE